MYVILAYDISDDLTRENIRVLLKRSLIHIQKSVFEGEISPRKLRNIVFEITRIMGENDRLIVIILEHKNFKRIIIGEKKIFNNVI